MDIGKALSDAAHGFTEPSEEEIRAMLDKYWPYVRDPKAWPILHIAAMQIRGCSTLILKLAWESPVWKPLFNDPTYRDKYNKQVWEQICQPLGTEIPLRTEIYAEANREEADHLRKFRPMAQDQIKSLMENQFTYLSSPKFRLLHKAAYLEQADQFLELAWKSEQWRSLFDSVYDDRTVFGAIQEALENCSDLEFEQSSIDLRLRILGKQMSLTVDCADTGYPNIVARLPDFRDFQHLTDLFIHGYQQSRLPDLTLLIHLKTLGLSRTFITQFPKLNCKLSGLTLLNNRFQSLKLDLDLDRLVLTESNIKVMPKFASKVPFVDVSSMQLRNFSNNLTRLQCYGSTVPMCFFSLDRRILIQGLNKPEIAVMNSSDLIKTLLQTFNQ